MSNLDAYVYAGYAPPPNAKDGRKNASVLARRPHVAERIQQLQEKQSHRIGVTLDVILRELQEFADLAKRIKQPSAGVGAVLAKAKLLGLVTDRIETTTVVRKPAREQTDQTKMSLSDWQQKFAPRPPDQPLQ